MAASDNLNRNQMGKHYWEHWNPEEMEPVKGGNPKLYHGSPIEGLNPGERIQSFQEPNSRRDMVHASDEPHWAGVYGRVYEVEPWDKGDLHQYYDHGNWNNPKDMSEVPGREFVSNSWRVVSRAKDLDAPPGDFRHDVAFSEERVKDNLKAKEEARKKGWLKES